MDDYYLAGCWCARVDGGSMEPLLRSAAGIKGVRVAQYELPFLVAVLGYDTDGAVNDWVSNI